MKENIWILLIGLAGLIYSFYKRSKKTVEKEKTPPVTTKPGDIFDTILSELEEIEQSQSKAISRAKTVPHESAFNTNEFGIRQSLKECNSENNTTQIKEMGIDESHLNSQEPFDLKEAIIYSTILQRKG